MYKPLECLKGISRNPDCIVAINDNLSKLASLLRAIIGQLYRLSDLFILVSAKNFLIFSTLVILIIRTH